MKGETPAEMAPLLLCALDELAAHPIPEPNLPLWRLVRIEAHQLSDAQLLVAQELPVPGRRRRIAVAHDLHSHLRHASLPRLPRAEDRVGNAKTHERVRRQAP
jgi:hypothetical protein